jgi:hypothetical protein
MSSTCKDTANLTELEAATSAAVVAYKEAVNRTRALNQASDAAREIAHAFGVVDHKSTDYKAAFEIACNAALAADAATASELAAKTILDTSFAAYKEATAAHATAAVVAYHEAANRTRTLNQASDAAREIARALGVVDCNSTDYKAAFKIACNAALAADAATASELAAKGILETSFAAYTKAAHA